MDYVMIVDTMDVACVWLVSQTTGYAVRAQPRHTHIQLRGLESTL